MKEKRLDPKWVDALKGLRKTHNVDTIAHWYGEPIELVDCVACINVFEKYSDVEKIFEDVKTYANKLIFFAIKDDAIRSIAWWKEALGKHFRINEWYGQAGEVCGTAVPIKRLGDIVPDGIKSYAAVDEKERIENVKYSTARIKGRLFLSSDVVHDRRAIIVCYGPSLKQSWNELRYEDEKGDIVSVSGAHDFLLERGFCPRFHIEMDPRPHKAKGICGNHNVKYLIASCCHPDLFDRLAGSDVTLWHLCNGEESMRLLHDVEPSAQMVMGGGNVGLRAIAMFYGLGYRSFSIYGMDCSFEDAGKVQHAGEHHGNKQKVIEVRSGDRWFSTSATLLAYIDHFMATVKRIPDARFELYGDGLLQHICNRLHNDSSATQKEKAA